MMSLGARLTFAMRPSRTRDLTKAALLGLLIVVRVREGVVTRRVYFGRGHPVYGLFDVGAFLVMATAGVAARRARRGRELPLPSRAAR